MRICDICPVRIHCNPNSTICNELKEAKMQEDKYIVTMFNDQYGKYHIEEFNNKEKAVQFYTDNKNNYNYKAINIYQAKEILKSG